MSNRVAGFYTTDDPYRAVASNHVYGYKYNPESKVLSMQFYNGSVYEFYGLHTGLVEGMEHSPSVGRYFWENIRMVYPKKLLGKKPLGYLENKSNIINDILPENKKLDALDLQERKLYKAWQSGEIDYNQYDSLMNVISNQKDILITKLEKKGYFNAQLQEEQEEILPNKKGYPSSVDTFKAMYIFGQGLFSVMWYCVKGTMQLLGLFMGLMFVLMK